MIKVFKKSRGFTLVELLVVIAIIGVLSSVVLVSLQSTRAKSRDARRLTDVKQIQNAIELYRDGNRGKAPAALADLTPTYIASVPVDPFTAVAYLYGRAGATGLDQAKYFIEVDLETASSVGAAGKYCFTSVDYNIKASGSCAAADAK